MLVKTLMSPHLVSATPDQTLAEARHMLDEHGIKHLPVVDSHGKLVGIITDRDVREAWASDATLLERHELEHLLHRIKIEEIMTREVATATPDTPVAEVAQLLFDRHIGSVIVVDDKRPAGIVTLMDIAKFVAGGGQDAPLEARA